MRKKILIPIIRRFLLIVSALQFVWSPCALAQQDIVVSGRFYQAIPEIVSLPLDAVIPPETYLQYDSRLIGASLVERFHHLFETENNDSESEFDYNKEAFIQIAFHANSLSQLLANGIRNQHQIERSGGTYDPEFRSNAENAMSRLKIESLYKWGPENQANQVRPKYSYLTFANNKDGQRAIAPAAWYGNIIATLKEEVKFRSTFSRGDSLLYSALFAKSRIAADHQDNAAFSAYIKDNPDIFSGYLFSFFYRSVQNLNRFIASPYWEAQIWGHLSLADVDYFLINCPDLGAPPTEKELASLKKVGAPIYNCVVPTDNSHWGKGTQVYAGDPVTQDELQTPMSGTDTEKLLIEK